MMRVSGSIKPYWKSSLDHHSIHSMTISFDLDDTLIPTSRSVPLEPKNILMRLLGTESLRLGTRQLFRSLRSHGHRIVLYTTSMREPLRVRTMFRLYGIPVDEVVNQQSHNARLGHRAASHSKLPSAFGIDFHVDDLPGVAIEGERYGFKTLILGQAESDWVHLVLRAVEAQSSDGRLTPSSPSPPSSRGAGVRCAPS